MGVDAPTTKVEEIREALPAQLSRKELDKSAGFSLLARLAAIQKGGGGAGMLMQKPSALRNYASKDEDSGRCGREGCYKMAETGSQVSQLQKNGLM